MSSAVVLSFAKDKHRLTKLSPIGNCPPLLLVWMHRSTTIELLLKSDFHAAPFTIIAQELVQCFGSLIGLSIFCDLIWEALILYQRLDIPLTKISTFPYSLSSHSSESLLSTVSNNNCIDL